MVLLPQAALRAALHILLVNPPERLPNRARTCLATTPNCSRGRPRRSGGVTPVSTPRGDANAPIVCRRRMWEAYAGVSQRAGKEVTDGSRRRDRGRLRRDRLDGRRTLARGGRGRPDRDGGVAPGDHLERGGRAMVPV